MMLNLLINQILIRVIAIAEGLKSVFFLLHAYSKSYNITKHSNGLRLKICPTYKRLRTYSKDIKVRFITH